MSRHLKTALGVVLLVFTGVIAYTKDYSEVFLGLLFVVSGNLISQSLLSSSIAAIASSIKSVLGAKKEAE